ncbi:hypothetical protein [Nordella sp. HKS 07]|uniref:hypothetical protein n=1 Tax=Nordella sp. HKS 07 TaxID=2712222 RepID=UPI001FED7174|nr:hypothetical protein [Nordella sp. HKS 07]
MTMIAAFFLLAPATSALADIPLLNAKCPGKIEVHADQGGPVYINGKQGKLKKFNNNYYEVRNGGVTISLSINPDGSPSASYTGKGGANGVCNLAGDTGGSAGECPPDVSQADRYKYPACN